LKLDDLFENLPGSLLDGVIFQSANETIDAEGILLGFRPKGNFRESLLKLIVDRSQLAGVFRLIFQQCEFRRRTDLGEFREALVPSLLQSLPQGSQLGKLFPKALNWFAVCSHCLSSKTRPRMGWLSFRQERNMSA